MTIKQGIFSLSLLEYLTDLKDSLSSLSLIFYMCLFPVIPGFLPWSRFTHPFIDCCKCDNGLEAMFVFLSALKLKESNTQENSTTYLLV